MSRTRGVSLLVVALSATLVACGAEVDLAKATFTRTTVPAGAGGGGGGSTSGTDAPKVNDTAFNADTLRKIDPCKVLDKDLLSTVGTPRENTASDFSQCSNFMQDPDGKDLNITLTLGEGLLEDPSAADKNVGGLPAIEQELDDKSACFQTAVTETSPNRGIKVQIGGKAPDMCGIGRKILEGAVTRIREDPPTYELMPGSLTEVDPCRAVPDADIKTVLGGGVKTTPTSLHWCTWSADGADVWVWLRNGVDPVKVADPAKTSKVDVGVPAVQEQDISSSAKCDVSWAHLPLRDNFAEVADVVFIRYTPKEGEDICGKAQTIAKALVAKLPKK